MTYGIGTCKQTGRCSHFLNLLTHLQLDFGKSDNVVLNNFRFCTKQNKGMDMKRQAADF